MQQSLLRYFTVTASGIICLGGIASAKPKPAKNQKESMPAAVQATGDRMNIILFMVDDLGYADMGYMGNKMVESPNIDNFARNSTVFTAGYAAPESSPSRAGILTGKNPARLHITTWIPQSPKAGKSNKASVYNGYSMPEESDGVALSEYLVSEALRDNGYDTWHIGKWHIGEQGNPMKQGFQCEIGYWPWSYPKSYFSPYSIPTLKDGPKGEYITDRLTAEAVDLIKNKRGDKPFFLNFWHYAVHEPLRAPDDEIDYYSRKGAPESGKNSAIFSAMKQSVDQSFGRVLEALEQEGIADKTIVIFFSDNGGVQKHADNGPLREGKKSLYEGGIRVPLIIRDPRHNVPGRVIDTPVAYVDFYPTMLDWAGIDPVTVKQHMDGSSFAPLLAGEKIADRALFWHEMGAFGHGPATAMQKNGYKLLKFYCPKPHQKAFELYDLSKDISENNDLSAKMPQLVAEMDKEIVQWVKDNKAQLPVKNQNQLPAKKKNK